MDFKAALKLMKKNSYCLWVGAGVSKYIGIAGNVNIPDWSEITTLIEAKAGLTSPAVSDFAERLEIAGRSLTTDEFDAFIREGLHYKICLAIVLSAANQLKDPDVVPLFARRLAKLALKANPIVSFNLEIYSSILLGTPCGPIAIRYLSGDPTARFVSRSYEPQFGARLYGTRFQRIVYHPHGAIEQDAAGMYVMKRSQYDTHEGSLAFQLAIHNTFASNLVIVGMSLNDKYLRDQIQKHRRYIGEIIWFTRDGSTDADINTWAADTGIERVLFPTWGHFWDEIEGGITAPTDYDYESSVINTWLYAVTNASNELETRLKLGGDLKDYHRLHGLPIGQVVYGIAGALQKHLNANGLTIGAPTKAGP